MRRRMAEPRLELRSRALRALTTAHLAAEPRATSLDVSSNALPVLPVALPQVLPHLRELRAGWNELGAEVRDWRCVARDADWAWVLLALCPLSRFWRPCVGRSGSAWGFFKQGFGTSPAQRLRCTAGSPLRPLACKLYRRGVESGLTTDGWRLCRKPLFRVTRALDTYASMVALRGCEKASDGGVLALSPACACRHLTLLHVAFNRALVSLPAALGELRSLRSLHANDCSLASLPASLGRCTAMEDLQLGYNRLVRLPSSMAALRRLRAVGLSGNPLVAPTPAAALQGAKAVLMALEKMAVQERLGDGGETRSRPAPEDVVIAAPNASAQPAARAPRMGLRFQDRGQVPGAAIAGATSAVVPTPPPPRFGLDMPALHALSLVDRSSGGRAAAAATPRELRLRGAGAVDALIARSEAAVERARGGSRASSVVPHGGPPEVRQGVRLNDRV